MLGCDKRPWRAPTEDEDNSGWTNLSGKVASANLRKYVQMDATFRVAVPPELILRRCVFISPGLKFPPI